MIGERSQVKRGEKITGRRRYKAVVADGSGLGDSYDGMDAVAPDGANGAPLLLVNILTGKIEIDRLRELWPTWAEPFRTGNGGRTLGIRYVERSEPVVALGAAHR